MTRDALDIPEWRLPPGVSRSLWQYTQLPSIADDYDEYFAYNKLFEFDEALVGHYFTRPGRLVDLGCGTGRLLVPFARRGFAYLGVDLSPHMLAIVRRKARAERLAIDCLRANLVELEPVRDGVADYATLMFSTLGMIRGHENRRRVLAHARRILKPGGWFVCHVHNRWYNLFDPQGRRWLARHFFECRLRRDLEPGDKHFFYRGVPEMFMHVYTRGEFRRALAEVGFHIHQLLPLDTHRVAPLPHPALLGGLRANGWIAVCQ